MNLFIVGVRYFQVLQTITFIISWAAAAVALIAHKSWLGANFIKRMNWNFDHQIHHSVVP